jgi:O-antigen/teichoic acid export membrane protein
MNPAFVSAYWALLIMMGGFVVSALCGSSAYLMTMTGHDRQFLYILAVSNGGGLVALTVLAGTFGGLGAAWGLLVATASWNIAVTVWARRHLRLDPSVIGVVFPPKRMPA